MAKILIVEDERQIAEYLVKYFKKADFDTLLLNSGEHVVKEVKAQSPDIIVLDLMLPEKDGISICMELREFSDIPVIMLTAKKTEIDRIIGLEAGADDYVCKPFNAKELVLRAKAILKRLNISSENHSLKLNQDNQILSFNTKSVSLTKLEFALAKLLFAKPCRIFSRQQIISLAYNNDKDIFERAVDTHIKNIRKKIKQLGIDETVIEGVYGAGYKYLPVTD